MKIFIISALLGAGLSAAGFASPAMAASSITDAFVANMKPNLEFLERSSELALTRPLKVAVRSYARDAVAETSRIAEGLSAVQVAASGPDADGVTTGRSAAIDVPAGLGQAANGRAPLDRTDLEELVRLSGRKFVDAFWLKQVDALSQLRADYETYAQDGDDPALVDFAKRELPVVEHRLALLAKV